MTISRQTQSVFEDAKQTAENEQKAQELMQQIVAEHVSTLSEASKEIIRAVYNFSAVTDRVETEKRGIYKLAEEVKNQKIEAGKLLYTLKGHIDSFPNIAAKSIQLSVGATSRSLDKSINDVVTTIQQEVSQTFQKQVVVINQAANETKRSANELVFCLVSSFQ